MLAPRVDGRRAPNRGVDKGQHIRAGRDRGTSVRGVVLPVSRKGIIAGDMRRLGKEVYMINYNNDVSDYWQWSNDPFMPIDDTNSAYKFGVNYVFYALTH